MKKPKVTRALGVAVLVGVATSASAINLTLSPGMSGNMPSDLSGGPPIDEIVDWRWSIVNQADPALGEFRARVDSVITQRADGTLAFWYTLNNLAQRNTPTQPIRFVGINFNMPTITVVLNQESDTLATKVAASTAQFSGNSVAFSYGLDPIVPGTSTTWAVIYTKLTDDTSKPDWSDKYKSDTTVVATANNDQVYWGFAPIPEPATYAGMFALGLAGFAAYRRFRA